MREAWSAGKTVAKLELEVDQRKEIADSLQPLKTRSPTNQSRSQRASKLHSRSSARSSQ